MRLQVGDDASQPVKLIVSTIAEAEFLLPTLVEYRKQGRQVNVGAHFAHSLPSSPPLGLAD